MKDVTADSPTEYETAFGHPKGLMVIFFTEMWERFGYYGMRALLVLYMTKHFLFTDDKAYGVYGAFTAFVYITNLFGGALADKLLGFRLASIIGASVMSIGYFILAFSATFNNDMTTIVHLGFTQWTIPVGSMIYFAALSLVALGNGFFKPNTASLVGTLYPPHCPKRTSGYTIFYMGVNLGSFLAPFACGYVGEVYGWSYGFLLTAIGLIIGLWVFVNGQHHMQGQGLPSHPERLSGKAYFGINNVVLMLIGLVAAVPFVAMLLTGNMTGQFLNLTGLFTLAYILYISLQSPKEERNRILSLLIMMFFYAAFFACYEQAGSSMNLFTDRNIDRHIFQFTVPTTFFQAVNPFFIITVAPLMATLWIKLAHKKLEPSTPVKFFIGLLLNSVGFYVLVLGTHAANEQGYTSMLWLILGILFMTVGELTISPIGLAMVSKLAPRKILGLLMGALMLSIAFGNYFAAVLAKLASVDESQLTASINPIDTMPVYGEAFSQIALIALVFSVAMFCLIPLIKKLMGEAKDSTGHVESQLDVLLTPAEANITE